MKTYLSKTILILSFIFIYTPTLLKSQVLNEGDNIISAGYGFGVLYFGDLFGDDDVTQSNTSYLGPIYLKYEHAVTDRFTIGINLAYAQYKTTLTDYNYNYYAPMPPETYIETYNTFSILARVNWHFGHINKFDPYWGFGLGYRSGTYTYSANDPGGTNTGDNSTFNFPVGFEVTIGARYYVTDMTAIYIETGFAKSVVQAGLSFKVR